MTEGADTRKYAKAQVRRMNKARRFPVNTCPSSRHVAMMAEALAQGKACPMIEDEPAHCACSLAATVAALWDARTVLNDLGYYNDGNGWKESK